MTDTPTTTKKPMPPRHVAIIMDGNGRWANARHLPRTMGHKQGVKAVKTVVEAAGEDDIVEMIENVEELTVNNDALTLTIALNYGGQQDIANAAAAIAAVAAETGFAPSAEEIFEALPQQLMTADLPAPDLLIRTSGEQRISNFMLWQCAYSEMVFTPVLWPDFGADDLRAAIDEYAGRDRRFGNVKSLQG